MLAQVEQGDCLLVMPRMQADSVDALVTDPPYGLDFMGKDWDHGAPGSHFWVEALRVAKPGAHLVAFGGTRTYHRLTCAIEDAGWQVRDCLMWLYATGFPKSLDVSKALDKAAGAERVVLGKRQFANGSFARTTAVMGQHGRFNSAAGNPLVTAPTSDDAKKWEGWGTALKPSFEPIVLARKPINGTVAANVLEYGTGGINIDGCRVGRDPKDVSGWSSSPGVKAVGGIMNSTAEKRLPRMDSAGRWPANLILDEEAARILDAQTGVPTSPGKVTRGGASRFYYCAKASKAERGAGNDHATVKPMALMRWLCRLVTPPGGVVLDPFMGSGTTGVAAVREGFQFMGIELDARYCEIAQRRLDAALDVSKLRPSR